MKSFGQRVWIYAAIAVLGIALMPAGPCELRKIRTPRALPRPTVRQSRRSLHPRHEGEQQLEQGGEADAIRNAPAVKWIAKQTGLTKNQAYWLCIGLNFAMIFLAIAGLMRKILPGYFKGRTSTIQKGIEEARKMSEDARRRLAEVEGRLSRLDSDIAAMQREADENAKAEEQRLLAAGEEERRRIVTSAEQEIEMAANTARRELKAYVAELAVQLAEKKIRVSNDTDEALVRAFTAQMGKDGN